jgi:hypothetical protein
LRDDAVADHHFGNELIAAARQRDDVAFTQDAPQCRDSLGDVVFLDDRVRPQGVDERLSRYRFAGVLDQKDEGVERSSAEGDRLSRGSLQPSTLGI